MMAKILFMVMVGAAIYMIARAAGDALRAKRRRTRKVASEEAPALTPPDRVPDDRC